MLTCEIESIREKSEFTMSEFITDYHVDISTKNPTDSGGFVNWDGKVIGADGQVFESGGAKVVDISLSMAKVPRAYAQVIADALYPDEEEQGTSNGISVAYASPAETTGDFLLKSYNATSRRFGDTWDIELSFTTDGVIDKTSGGGL